MLLHRTLTAFAACLCAASLLSCGDDSDLSGPGRIASLALTPANVRLEPGQTAQLTALVYDANGAVLTGHDGTWRTSDADVATVSSSGLVTGVGNGTAGVSIAVEGRSVTARITVGFSIAEVEISPGEPVVMVGQGLQLEATAFGAGGKVLVGPIFEWSSSDRRVATVSVGKLRGLRPGTVLIEARSEGRSDTTTATVIPASTVPQDPI